MALDAALREIDEDRKAPSPEFRRRFGLMLGLERILSQPTPSLASGLTLRPHQVDALAGMLAALIGDAERGEEEDEANGADAELDLNGDEPPTDELEDDDDDEDEDDDDDDDEEDDERRERPPPRTARTTTTVEAARRPDPGARRRYRFKHPTASGKTVAAAGFVDACRIAGVLILTHRRLLVDQFNRDLKEQGYGDRLRDDAMLKGRLHPRPAAGHRRDLRLVHQARRLDRPRRLRRGHLRRGPHRARRAHLGRDPPLLEADLHRHDGDRPAAAEARRRRLPGRDRRLPAERGGRRGRRRAAALAAGAARGEPAQRARSSAATTTRSCWPRRSTTRR